MGSLRFILALSVFLAHTGSLFGLRLVGSSIAVQSFFIISGFYMALILNEKYRGQGSYYLFITNRLLRLLPAYWVVLAITVLTVFSLRQVASEEPWVVFNFSMYFPLMDLKTQVLVIFSNIFIVGQDILRIFRIDPQSGFLMFTADPTKAYGGIPPMYEFFFVPPAWSISTELLFYFVAPFLARGRKGVVVALIAASLLLRAVMFQYGYQSNIWRFQFFPAELAFFLLGVLSYRLYAVKKPFFSTKAGLYAAVAVIGATLLYQFIPVLKIQGASMNKWVYYAVLIFLIPGAFRYTGRFKIDRYLGELSYPIYIIHYPVLWVWMLFREDLLDTAPLEVFHVGMLVITLALSMALYHLVINPLERFRQARVNKATYAAPQDAG